MQQFGMLTEQARRVLTVAQEEATRFNHNYIGTEHVLLGLVREGEGVAAQVLRSLGVELNRVRSAVEFIIGRGDRMIVSEIGLTPRAKKVIELAVDEARRLGHDHVGTEHLLLGLVREGEGIAAGVLESLGVSLEKVRRETILVLAGEGDSVPSMSGEERGGSARGGLVEGAIERGGRRRWSYLLVAVSSARAGDASASVRLNGQASDRFGAGIPPLYELLRVLGAEGWELAALDHTARTRGAATSRYIFKRPA